MTEPGKPNWNRPVKLSSEHNWESFDCGQDDLNEWAARHALTNQRAGMSRVWVSTAGQHIAGYYALATGGVEHGKSPTRVTKGIAKHAIPVVILTRLAVAVDHQRRGLGHALLTDSLRRVETASEEVGVRALLVHAKDEQAKAFYMAFGEFEESPTDPLHLFLLMKDLRKALP